MNNAIHNDETYLVDAYWKKLSTLSLKAKLQLASLLTAAALKEESLKETQSSIRRTCKVKRRAANIPSDNELETRFSGTEMPEIPEDPSWEQVINGNTGKTIKSIEKWL